MLFFHGKVEVPASIADDLASGRRRRDQGALVEEIRNATVDFWEKTTHFTLFVSNVTSRTLNLGGAAPDNITQEDIMHFLKHLGIEYRHIELAETSFQRFQDLHDDAYHNDYIGRDTHLLADWKLNNPTRLDIREELFPITDNTEEALVIRAHEMLSDSLAEEVQRILSGPNPGGIIGHPVHYVIKSEDPLFQREARDLLLQALHWAGRVKSQRLTTINNTDLDQADYEFIYDIAAGGTVCIDVIRAPQSRHRMYRRANAAEDLLKRAAVSLEQHYDDVLTIFQLGRQADDRMDILRDELPDSTLVTISEDSVDSEQAAHYLKGQAHKLNLEITASLTADLDPDSRYAPSELNQRFAHWKKERLKTEIYPQYSGLQCFNHDSQHKKPVGSAYDTLSTMIGLDDIKREIQGVLDYFKAQKLFRDRGFTDYTPTMHMAFSGSPGTAKTTAARLVAQILKDNKVLSSGHILEVGRQDIVGMYVGHTAPQVARLFARAEGGVLFIDEAYSLVDDRRGLYGDEAINAIVQEMENNRSNTVVIFAGYTDKMEEFLQTNPGLRSRIAAHIKFPDYTTEELYLITEHLADQLQLTLDPDVREKLLAIYEHAASAPDFGNGRYVRSMLEHARMKQSSRLLQMDLNRLSNEQIHTLTDADFCEIPTGACSERRIVGFSA